MTNSSFIAVASSHFPSWKVRLSSSALQLHNLETSWHHLETPKFESPFFPESHWALRAPVPKPVVEPLKAAANPGKREPFGAHVS